MGASQRKFKTDGNASFLRAARAGNLEKLLEYLKGSIDINTSNANGLNALHLASKEGHENVVAELLKRGANVNAATKKGNTALHIASLAGQEQVVKILVQNGANVNVQSQNGFTPLYMAAQENHDNVVRFLLSNGANQSLSTEDGFTPLAVALQQGHNKVVSVLLENDTIGKVRLPALHIAAKKDDCKAAALLLQNDHNPDVTSKSGFTPLHISAHYGNENMALVLLEKGADVNFLAKHQITPLHVASKWGKTNMVNLLIDKGAKIDAATRDGLTPLHCAARSGHDQVVDMLVEKGAPITAKTKNGLAPVHMAAQGDHVDCARILLYHKVPVDDVTVDYLTPLHVAAHCGHVRVAKLLLDRKADPNARALNGFTPLHIACKKNRMKVVELLLKLGASIEATTESGLTPLHVAAFMGCMNIVVFLIQNGTNPDIPTIRGETPLHLAARAHQTDIIRILLRNGAQVDARAREQQSPLHIAARLGNVDIVGLLLQHGAAVDATTNDMYTSLHIAAKEGQEEVTSVLIEHGASTTVTTKKGFTPLHLAAKYGNIKVARLLLQKDAPVDAQGKNGVTPLHVAAHYDHVNVALLLLDKGASPHSTAKNGYTPLHVAAKKNQMDIATTLLEYGAKANVESKAGFTPLHLAAQAGHTDITTLLIEHQADVNAAAKNGLTPLHLCAQEDRVKVAAILVKNGGVIDPQTKAGYTPLHVASHFGQVNMVRFLLQHAATVNSTTTHGYTPLHQAAQQGHTFVVTLLLEGKASPNTVTNQGQTPLSIAQRLGYISVVESLKVVTETVTTTTTTVITEDKYKVVAPEIMQETFLSDSEDEGGDDFEETTLFGKPTHATHVYLPYYEGQKLQTREDTMAGDQSMRYMTADDMKFLGDDSLTIDVTKDEKPAENMVFNKHTGAPLTIQEEHLSPQYVNPNTEAFFVGNYAPDNIDISRAPVHSGKLKWKTFLVSFMVDARGGAMRGCRHSGVRVIIPPRKAPMPMRITCRYLRKEKLAHPPPLMEGEACASRILEVGPAGAKFLGPVILEVPHFASLRGKEREITVLRSDSGETWKEHVPPPDDAVHDVLNESFEGEEFSALEDLNTNRITRIVTMDFPQYFAIITRIRQEVHTIGPEGGMVSSTVVPQVQAIFPEGALTKKIKVGLQAQPIPSELVSKMLGNRVGVSPIVTIEPRRRKFHKPITLTIPVPQAASKGMINQYSGDAPTLRLLCSITGATTKAQWEDVTGSTPLTFVNECVSFTTTVSARFWLMDCRQINEATKYATELYREAVNVPFMAKFVVFIKRHEPMEAQLRVFCMTDDKEDKTLENQKHFIEVAKSRDVEVLEGKSQYLEFVGNLVPVTKSGEQLTLMFQAFRENRLPFIVRVKDPHQEAVGRIAFMREPRVSRGDIPQTPICNLNIVLPDVCKAEGEYLDEIVTLERKYGYVQESGLARGGMLQRADLRLVDVAREIGSDWERLAFQLDIPEWDVNTIKNQYPDNVKSQSLMMLQLWAQKPTIQAKGNVLENALRKIAREDVLNNCMFNVHIKSDEVEKAVAKIQQDQSEFDNIRVELGRSREASLQREMSLDVSYDEQDLMKEAESAEETSSETGSVQEKQLPEARKTSTKEGVTVPGELMKHVEEEVEANIQSPEEQIQEIIIRQHLEEPKQLEEERDKSKIEAEVSKVAQSVEGLIFQEVAVDDHPSEEPPKLLQEVTIDDHPSEEQPKELQDITIDKQTSEEPPRQLEDVTIDKQTSEEPSRQLQDIIIAKQTSEEPPKQLQDVTIDKQSSEEPSKQLQEITKIPEMIQEVHETTAKQEEDMPSEIKSEVTPEAAIEENIVTPVDSQGTVTELVSEVEGGESEKELHDSVKEEPIIFEQKPQIIYPDGAMMKPKKEILEELGKLLEQDALIDKSTPSTIPSEDTQEKQKVAVMETPITRETAGTKLPTIEQIIVSHERISGQQQVPDTDRKTYTTEKSEVLDDGTVKHSITTVTKETVVHDLSELPEELCKRVTELAEAEERHLGDTDGRQVTVTTTKKDGETQPVVTTISSIGTSKTYPIEKHIVKEWTETDEHGAVKRVMQNTSYVTSTTKQEAGVTPVKEPCEDMERDRVNRTPVSPVAFENSAFAGVDVIDAEGEGSCQVRSPYEVSPEKMEWPDAEKTLDSSSKCVYEQQLTGSKLFQTDFPQEGLPSKYIGITSHIEAEHEVFPHKRKRSVSPDSSVDYTSIFPSVKLAEEEKTSQYQLLESSTMKDARYTENELLIHGTDEVNSKEILGHVDSFQDSYPQELCAEGFEMVSKDLYWESNRPESPFEIITKEEIEDIQYLMMKKHTSQNLQKIYSNVAKQDEIQSSMEPLTQSKEVCDNSLESTVRRKEIKESTVQNKQDKIILDKSRESVTTFSDENLFKPKEDATETKNKPKVDDTVEGKQLYDSLEGLPSFLYDVEIREGSSFLTESGTVVLHEKTEPYGTSEKRLGWDYHSTFQNNQIFLAEPKKSVVNTKEIDFGQDDKARDDLPQGARESLPRISASSRTISLEFEQDSDDSVNLSDTPAVSGSEDVLTVLETYINAPTSQTSFPRNVRDFSLDTSRSSMYPTLVEYKEEEEESLQDEPMEVESDKGVDEADDLSEVDTTTRYHYRMQFDRDFFYEFETEPDFRPLYTHQEEDEDAYEDTFQYRSEKPLSPIMASDEEKLSTPDYESVEAKKFFSRSDERDDESLSSLQEFERLEAEIIRGRKSSQSSLDSLNNKQQHSKSGENDDVSMNSLTEFELLERECAETERIEAMAKEERARLSEIEEGHESQISEGSQDTLSDGRADGKDSSGSEDFEERLHKADRITTQVQANVEQFHIVQSGSEFPQEGSGLGITDDLINSVPSVEQNLSHEVVTTNARIGHVETAFYSHSGEISSDFSDDGDLQESVSVTLGSMERVPNLNENYPSHKEPKPVSTHFFREVRKPDVDYALEATDQTLSQTSEPNLCTDNIREKHSSLQEAKIKELIEYIGQTESKKLNLKVIAEEDQEWVENNIKDVSPSQNDTSSSGKDSHGIDKRGEWFPSSCESVDPSSSAGTLATYQFDTDSVMSSSLNSMHTSGEESTMISSTDTLGFDYQMSSPFGETHPGTVPVITEQPELDQEGNICISSRDNILFEENIPSKAPRDKQHFITEKTRSSNVDHLPCGVGVIKSDFVEGLESLDENDRKILIERVKQNIVLNQRHSISTESQEALEEFFRKQLEGAKENLERTFDEKSNIIVDRSSKQPSKVEDHLEQFNDCGELHPHDRGKKMLDEDGNIIWTTSKVVIPPQVKMVTLSKFNKEKRFLQHPQMLTTKDFGISDKDTSYSHYSPTPTQSSEMSYTSETLGSCMDVIDADQCLLPQAASGMQTGSGEDSDLHGSRLTTLSTRTITTQSTPTIVPSTSSHQTSASPPSQNVQEILGQLKNEGDSSHLVHPPAKDD